MGHIPSLNTSNNADHTWQSVPASALDKWVQLLTDQSHYEVDLEVPSPALNKILMIILCFFSISNKHQFKKNWFWNLLKTSSFYSSIA